jgi:ABC-type glycerol-3-phosphate transport system substrate-binding protein
MDSITKARPFQVIFMIVFALLALTGLYVFANFTGFGGGGPKIGALVIWGTLPQSAMTQELAAITTANKNFSKVTYVQEQAATFDGDLANAIASGDGPDLILISQDQLLAEEGKINVIPFSSISQRTFLNTYLPEDQLYLTANGTYGIPFTLDPLVLYYNQTMLSQAGIAQPPSSWEAVTGLAPSLTLKNASNVITQSAVALGTYANIENARAIISLLLLQSGSTITQSSNLGIRSTLAQGASSSNTGISPAAAALGFYTQFADPTRTVYSWNASIPSARQAFVAGDLAFYVGFASEEPLLKASNPNLSFDMAPIPQPQTSAAKADYGLAYAFAIPKASKNQTGAYLVASALASAAQLPAVSQALSMAPANRTLLSSISPSDAYAPVYYPEALIASGWLSPAPSVTDTIFSAMITSVNSGGLTAVNAIDAADQALDSVLPSSN